MLVLNGHNLNDTSLLALAWAVTEKRIKREEIKPRLINIFAKIIYFNHK